MDYNATERHTRVMYDLLVKNAEETPTDEDKSTVGVNPDLQPDPDGRAETQGTMDAPWGERGKESPLQFSDAVAEEFINSRQRMLEELFDAAPEASKAERALVDTYLDNPGDYRTSAPLLEEKQPGDRTLRELTEYLSR